MGDNLRENSIHSRRDLRKSNWMKLKLLKLQVNKTAEMRKVKQYSLNQQVFYFKRQTPIFVATRDVCEMRHRYVNEKGQTVVAVYSEEHPDVPVVKKNVRVELGTGGYIMTPLASGKTHVSY